MDTSGNIRHIEYTALPRDNEILLNSEKARELSMQSFKTRKNWMRNQPCICGSGKKFKRCCWTKASRLGAGEELGKPIFLF